MPHDSATPPATDNQLLQAAQAFFPDLTATHPVPGHGDIIQVATPAGPRRVRRWPSAATEAEITFIRDVMATARGAGLSPVPALMEPPLALDGPVLRHHGRLCDAQEWLPGSPPPRAQIDWPGPDDWVDIPVAIAPAQFAQVIAVIAALHDATASIADRRDAPTAPLAMLPDLVGHANERHRNALRPRARREPAIQRWLAASERLLAAAAPVVVEATQAQLLPTTVLHLGLWPAHVLIENGSVAGLLGWEQVAVGSPLLDLAQATLRLQGWSADTVEAAVGAYADIRPLSPDERRLLPAVAALDAVAAAGRLLEQTYAVAETARPPTALRAGIDSMLRSLTALERSLNAQATVGKSKRTPWRRGPGPRPSRDGGRPRERRR